MREKQFTYSVHEITEYINWDYFFHAWGFSSRFANIANVHECDSCRALWLASFPEEEQAKASEAIHLFKDAKKMLTKLDNGCSTHALCRLCSANSDGDDLLLDDMRLPLLRQQAIGESCICLSDFVRPLSGGISDCVGVFATTVDHQMEELFPNDSYANLLAQTLADRLAEATAEVLHLHVRRHFWGYAPNEHLSIKQLHREEFQGIRPAVGYPSLPDLSVNFIIDKILEMNRIGITLTENGAMRPHASVSGLMIAHPKSHYFAINKITKEQLVDYATRRGIPIIDMEKFLRKNLICNS